MDKNKKQTKNKKRRVDMIPGLFQGLYYFQPLDCRRYAYLVLAELFMSERKGWYWLWVRGVKKRVNAKNACACFLWGMLFVTYGWLFLASYMFYFWAGWEYQGFSEKQKQPRITFGLYFQNAETWSNSNGEVFLGEVIGLNWTCTTIQKRKLSNIRIEVNKVN